VDRIVVVGAGLAGLRAAEELRDLEFGGELTVVGEEEHAPYNRPPLSKQVLAGDMDPDDCLFGTDDELDITWKLGSPAKGLDIEERAVTLDDGEELSYDGLVIATGRRAREWPDLPDLAGFHTLRTLDDSIALRDAVAFDSPRVVIVGAGFIGCEVAATLRRRGLEEVALIDVAPYPMPVLGAQVGERAAQLHTDEGVKLHLEANVEGFEGSDRVEAVCLEGGTRIEADLVLIALGSVANSDWLKGSGLEFESGAVLCDACCVAKGTTDVVAAGDIAAWLHPQADGPIWVEHWSNAAEMARAAVKNLLADPDERTPFAPVPTFWSDQYDTSIKSVGLFERATDVSVVEEDREAWKVIIEGHRDDELMGAVTWNRNKAFIGYMKQLRRAQAGG